MYPARNHLQLRILIHVYVRETLAGLDVDKEWLDDFTRELLHSYVEERVDIIIIMMQKSRGADSEFTGISERDVELCWSRTDQLNRNSMRGENYVDVKHKAALSTYAAIEALADRLGMLLLNILIKQT